eukprot:SAG11_NODE_700_length_7673_cov_7.359255_6_plen_65_part_00
MSADAVARPCTTIRLRWRCTLVTVNRGSVVVKLLELFSLLNDMRRTQQGQAEIDSNASDCTGLC